MYIYEKLLKFTGLENGVNNIEARLSSGANACEKLSEELQPAILKIFRPTKFSFWYVQRITFMKINYEKVLYKQTLFMLVCIIL